MEHEENSDILYCNSVRWSIFFSQSCLFSLFLIVWIWIQKISWNGSNLDSDLQDSYIINHSLDVRNTDNKYEY